jgi:hypothetical protein
MSEKILDHDLEAIAQFRLNRTGNIYYSGTDELLQKETKDLFDSVTVLFSAMTKAMTLNAAKDKQEITLFDINKWGRLIRGSGFFVEVQKYRKTLEIRSNSISVNTQIINQMIPGITSGASMEIAKGVLASIDSTFKSATEEEKEQFGHLLFYCEEIMGTPSVTVRLINITQENMAKRTETNCSKSVSKSYSMDQAADTFLFVSPDVINRFAGDFGNYSEEYDMLVDTLVHVLKSSEKS